MSETVSDKDVDLLMIGRTGNGKSALGNAILQRDIFISSGDVESITFNVEYEYGEFDGRKLKVVDAPGVGETRLSEEESTNHIMMSMEYAIKTNPEGYHAFLLVVKYGQRFTIEEKNAIKFLRNIFGEDFVNKFCIIVMTGGDNFERDSIKKTSNITFPEWCDKQPGDFHELLKECSNRIVLFDNVTANEEKKNNQVADLLKMVENLASSGKRYTDANFEATKAARDKLMIESKEPMIRNETMRETSLILDKLRKIIDNENLTDTLLNLSALFVRATELYESTKEQDKGTGVLHQMLLTTKNIKNQIKKEIKLVKSKADDIVKNKEKERKHNIEMQKIKEEAERKIKEEQIALEKANQKHEEKRKILEENLKKRQEDQRRKEEELKKELAEAQRKEDEWKEELAEAKRKEEEIEKHRKLYEAEQRQHDIEMQKLKEEAERKIKEEHIAMEKKNKENDEKRKLFEEDLKNRQEEQRRKEEELKKQLAEAKRKEEEIEQNRKLYEEKKIMRDIEIQKFMEEVERKIKEKQNALELENQDIEEKRKKIEHKLKRKEEEQKRKEAEWEKEQADAKRKLTQEQQQEKERQQDEIENLIKDYKDVKAKSDEGFLSSLGQMIKLSAVKIMDGVKYFFIDLIANKIFNK